MVDIHKRNFSLIFFFFFSPFLNWFWFHDWRIQFASISCHDFVTEITLIVTSARPKSKITRDTLVWFFRSVATTKRWRPTTGGPGGLWSVPIAAARSCAVRRGTTSASDAPGDGVRAQQPNKGRGIPVPRVQRGRERCSTGAKPKATTAKTQARLGGWWRYYEERACHRPNLQEMLRPLGTGLQREPVGERRRQPQEHRRRLSCVTDQGQSIVRSIGERGIRLSTRYTDFSNLFNSPWNLLSFLFL